MPAALDLNGMVFGQLTVLERSHREPGQTWKWRCRCACTREVFVQGSILKAGLTSACSSCASTAKLTTHGMTGEPLYRRWRAMLGRTGNPNASGYHNYGGRGITVCERWRKFEGFATDMGPTFSPELELDRIDVDGNYEPANCRWTDRTTQQRNRRNNRILTHAGRSQTVVEWAEELGVKANTLQTRLRRGWPTERVLLEIANAE